MNGLQQHFLSGYNDFFFSTKSSEEKHLKMQEIVARGTENSWRDYQLISKDPNLAPLMSNTTFSQSQRLFRPDDRRSYTYEFACEVYKCYDTYKRSVEEHTVQFAPLEVTYEEQIISSSQEDDTTSEVEENTEECFPHDPESIAVHYWSFIRRWFAYRGMKAPSVLRDGDLNIPVNISIQQDSEWIRDLTLECVEPNPGPLTNKVQLRTKKRHKNHKKKRPNNGRRKNANKKFNFNGRNPDNNRFGPPVTRSRLAYISDLVQVGASGYTVKTFQVCINDMDPAILSTIMAGQERYTTYYFEYLNYSVMVTAKCTNIAGEAVNFYMNISTQDWTTLIATWQDARDCAENPNSTKPVTWDQNVDTKTVTQLFKPADLLPRGIYKFSEIYAGLFNANPVAPIFINLVWYADNSGAEVKVDTNIEFDVWSSWYIQRNQRDSGPLEDNHIRTRSLRNAPPVTLTPEEKQIAEKNSLAWTYAKSAPPRRDYDHLAGKKIIEQEHIVRPVNQTIKIASRAARCA